MPGGFDLRHDTTDDFTGKMRSLFTQWLQGAAAQRLTHLRLDGPKLDMWRPSSQLKGYRGERQPTNGIEDEPSEHVTWVVAGGWFETTTSAPCERLPETAALEIAGPS